MAVNYVKNIQQCSALSASQFIKLKSGVVNKGLAYEIRITTYFAMILNNNEKIIDFTMFTSPDGLRPIDDVVVEIIFVDDDKNQKRETWLMQIKHVMNHDKKLRCIYLPQKDAVKGKVQPQKDNVKGQSQDNPRKESRYPHTLQKTDEDVKGQSKYHQAKGGTQSNQVKHPRNNKNKKSLPQPTQKTAVGEDKGEENIPVQNEKEDKHPRLDINLAEYAMAYKQLELPISEDGTSNTQENDIRLWLQKENVSKILLFTNANTMDFNNDAKKNVLPLTKVERSSSWSGPFNDLVNVLKLDNCMECLKEHLPTEEEFLDKFYCFVLQPNSDDILKHLEGFEVLKGFSRDMLDQLCDLIESHMSCHSNIAMCTPLTKTVLSDMCLMTIMTNKISLRTCISIKAVKQYADIWSDIFSKYQIVQLNPHQSAEDSERLLRNITGYYEYTIQQKYDPGFDWEKCVKRCFKLDESIRNKVRNAFTLAELLLHMWKFDRLPLIIDQSVNNLFFKFLHKGHQINGCFFVIAESSQFPEDIKKLDHIKELSKSYEESQIYNDIINLEVSLQGRKPVLLGQVFDGMEHVTATDLLHWTGQHKKHERSLNVYQRERNDKLLTGVQCYNNMLVEIFLDIQEEHIREDTNASEERDFVFDISKKILSDVVREGNFLMWTGGQDQKHNCKLSKSQKLFEHEYEVLREFPANRKTLKVSLELEQQVLSERIVDMCRRASENLTIDDIMNTKKAGYKVLKVKKTLQLSSNIYCLPLNVYVTQDDNENHQYAFGKIDFNLIQKWMRERNIGIDALIPKEIIIKQPIDIVSNQFRIRGGELKITLQNRNDILDEIIQKFVDDIKNIKDYSGWKNYKIQIPQIGHSLNIKSVDRTKIDRTFLIEDGTKCSEDQMGSRIRKHLVSISNIPGMGKTTVLKYIAVQCNPEDYVLIFDLANCVRNIKQIMIKPINYIFNMIQHEVLEGLLFGLHLKKKRVKILLDSFDEVLPSHQEDALLLLENVLKEDLYTIVTTRNQAEELLKNKFQGRIEIIRLLELKKEEIERFCKNEGILPSYIDKLGEEFLKTPLHLHMLCDIITGNKEVDKFELCDFFKEFIDRKIEIFFKEKLDVTDHDRHRLGIKDIKRMYYYISLVYIFDRENTNDIIDDVTWTNTVHDFNNFILPLGIVSQIGEDNTIKFTHKSYAEYLVAEWFCNEFLQDNRHHMRLYLKILENNQVHLLNFLNDMATADCTLHIAIKNRDKPQVRNIMEGDDDWKTHLNKPDRLGRYPIHVAAGLLSNNDAERIDYFEILELFFKYSQLLDTGSYWVWDESLIRMLGRFYKERQPDLDIVYENNTSVHLAATIGNLEHVRYLLEIGHMNAHLIKQNYENMNVLHLATYYGHEKIVRYLVSDIKMNSNRLVVLQEFFPHTQRSLLEFAEFGRAPQHIKRRIINFLKDNGCVTNKFLQTGVWFQGTISFRTSVILALCLKLSKDSNCRDFEILINVPDLSIFKDMLVIYTSVDNEQTAYFVQTKYYKMKIYFDDCSDKKGIDNMDIASSYCQDDIKTIGQNLNKDWQTHLTNIDNYMCCMYTTKTLEARKIPEIEPRLSICPNQEVFKYCITDTNSNHEILVYTKTVPEVELRKHIHKEIWSNEPNRDKSWCDDGKALIKELWEWIGPLIFSVKVCRPLSKFMFELLCFKHSSKLKIAMSILNYRSLHCGLFDKWVKLFQNNPLIYMDSDYDHLAYLAGYYHQYIRRYYDESFNSETCQASNELLEESTKDSIRDVYGLRINELDKLLDVLWMFDNQPRVIKYSVNLEKDLEAYAHLNKHFIVLIDKDQQTPGQSMFDSSTNEMTELVESIKLVTGNQLTLPCPISDLLRASVVKSETNPS